ncbi:hypothetical protein GCM10027299_03470 [Larkinella ripae]
MREKMSLEEEIAIVRFGQGVLSDADLRASFSPLDKERKKNQLLDLTSLVHHAKPVDADIERAIAASGLEPTDAAVYFLKTDRLRVNRVFITPEDELDSAYLLQLHLFKIAYQRRYALEKGRLTQWWFWDLAADEVVQRILAAHQQLVDDVYQNPGYRGEFVSMVKLQLANEQQMQARFQEPAPEPETHFTFLTYDDMLTAAFKIDQENKKYSEPLFLLRHAMGKALSKKYGLDFPQELRLMQDVLERYRQENRPDGLAE